MSSTAAVELYAAVPELALRGWPGEDSVAVFTAADGRTHLVSLLAATILEEASAGARPLHDVAAAVFGPNASNNLSESEGDPLSMLRAAAEGLVQAGLLTRTECPSPSAPSGPSTPHPC